VTAYAIAQERWRAQSMRLQRVALARPLPVRSTVGKRNAADVPFTPRPISVLRPVGSDTDATLRAFVVAEFREAAKKGG